ncbi:2-deoxy-D-gluconate 3-dehydrogenase [Actinomycetes bacterium]|nr:2-deoxy-D-gluconate 3-dehydrogenase [Actinomycetes bacterium]
MSYQGIFDLTGKTAVVTGARKGIGFAMASILAEFGANIIAVSSKQEPDDELKKVVSSFGVEFTAIACDLRERSETKSLISTLKDSKIDILVNNAGIANRGVVLEHTDEQWDQTIELDLNAPFFLSREFARGMAARGSGKIIFTASMWTFLGGKNVISYTAAKTALGGLTRGLSNELSPMGINVNAIAPGFIETDINSAVRQDKARFEFLSSRIPMGRWGKPSDLAGATLFLASTASNYVTGVVLPVDGGYLAN